jgi:hypothetical protein
MDNMDGMDNASKDSCVAALGLISLIEAGGALAGAEYRRGNHGKQHLQEDGIEARECGEGKPGKTTAGL